MAAARRGNGDGDADSPSFMARHFPDVEPLAQRQHPPHEKRSPLPRRRVSQAVTESIPPLAETHQSTAQADDALHYRGDGVQKRVMSRLQRGQMRPQARLDLHGLTREPAFQALRQFVTGSQSAGLRCVLVIHGQGYRSADNVPVLKRAVDGWLRQLPQVLAFCSAIPPDGGTGAVYVLLRHAAK